MIGIGSSTSLLTAFSVLFAVKLFASLGSVILAGKCSVKHASLTGWAKILPLNVLLNAVTPKLQPFSVKHYSGSTMISISNAAIRNAPE